ncbi:MAG: Hsp20/alpha crystallin family protein [Methanobacteriota archaeon]|nr:MAG: Hsp20/alpha crystallin family protein [Euryarchaeota archaeon]
MSGDDSFEDMRKTINRMLKDAFEGKLGVFREPFVYGFTMRNREARGEGSFQAVEGQEIASRDPLVDVILDADSIHVTAELPGAHDDDVRARVDGLRMIVEADGEKRYYTAVDLPEDVDPLSLDCTFRNGVLDATLKRRRPVPRA